VTDEKAIRELIARLNGEDTNEAAEAEASLRSCGEAILLPLLDAAPGFGRFGQLCAIDLLRELGDPRAGSVLTSMLLSEYDTVREWAADALGEIGVKEAVPELRRAYDEVRRGGTTLDSSEPETLRRALTALGARTEVVPSGIETSSRVEGKLGRCWAVEDLGAVLEALANADQLILSFQFWERWNDTHTCRQTPRWEFDWSLSWPELVAATRVKALEAAHIAGTPKNTVATLSWMKEEDV
jgi:hypothetical protein